MNKEGGRCYRPERRVQMVKAYEKEFDISEEVKSLIDGMSQYELAYKIRFSKMGDPLMCGATGDYLTERFRELGGMTPEISKMLGWK